MRANRRGIVLVLVLAMLGLLALVGITFATFAGQARINNRNYMLSLLRPQADELIDFALAQLITDTNDIRSVIHGHSLARDMYGNNGGGNGYLTVSPSTGAVFSITAVALVPNSSTLTGALYNLTTSIISNDSTFFGYNTFNRWTIRVSFPGTQSVAQSFEILGDTGYNPNSNANRVLTVNISNADFGADPATGLGPTVLTNPTQGIVTQLPGQYLFNAVGGAVALGPNFFILDGRWLHAFNGAGMGSTSSPATGFPNSYYANFRYNGGLGVPSPNAIGMDEDYDACDLENWFLAIQSADGQVMIPSFHRPAIIRVDPNGVFGAAVNDWTRLNLTNPNLTAGQLWADSAARILRPCWADGHDQATFPNLVSDPTSGKIAYDVDNDGDGVTDSVWLDLGYPARRDSSGRLYKPLFAFMVIGLNGRIPLNTAGNLAFQSANGIGDVGGVNYPPGVTMASTPPPPPVYGGTANSLHLGNSVSEVDPTYALQNAFDSTAFDTKYAFFPPLLGNPNATNPDNSQVDNAGIDVRLTQLRNLLTGTRPQLNPTINPAINDPGGVINGDNDFVLYSNGSAVGQAYFMPNGIANTGMVPQTDVPQIDPNTMLPYVVRITPPVPGRWGEAQSIPGVPFPNPLPSPAPAYVSVVGLNWANPVRAGYSEDIGDILNGLPRDAADDNYNSYDAYPSTITNPARLGEVGDLDLYDAVGALMLPVERMRRWVTPADINGTGTVDAWTPGARGANRGTDAMGRVEFNSYFRPPGSPGMINTPFLITPSLPASANVYYTPPLLTTTGAITFNFPNPTGAAPPPYWPDQTSNPLHGFESYRFPSQNYDPNNNAPLPNNVGAFTPQRIGGVPVDLNLDTAVAVPPAGNGPGATNMPTAYPTYDYQANARVHSDGLNEADEMNLYSPNPLLDSPFGFGDLEWLYRQQDVDGASLSSRLAQLAPISFTNGIDGPRRRKLFSLQSWDLNNFVWTNDNPGNAFATNSRFTPTASAGFSSLNVAGSRNPVVTTLPLNPTAGIPAQTPTLAQREKKINLNYPLPVSNDPNEPVRQKWISDAYQLLKAILPPKAVDTAEELAQLSQFVINIIDFRDPDCTMTHWVNPDVVINLGFAPPPTTTYPQAAVQALPATAPTLLAIGQVTTPANTIPLDQYGMEYNPVALNEVLAFSYQYITSAGGTPLQSNRFFVELVNTLTGPEMPTGSAFNPSACLDLGGFQYTAGDPYSGGAWDIVFTADDPYSRPDPYRGQLLPCANTYALTPLNQDSFTAATDVVLTPLNQNGVPTPPNPQTTTPPIDYFYVFGNAPASAANETGIPSINPYGLVNTTFYDIPASTPSLVQTLSTASAAYTAPASFDPVTGAGSQTSQIPLYPGVLPNFSGPTTATTTPIGPSNYRTKLPPLPPRTALYYWVCLRRPANPFAPVSALNPMVVVDSVRFPYMDGTGPIGTTKTTGGVSVPNQPPTNGYAAYSAQRYQPYRGGHAVPAPAAAFSPTVGLDPRYGYSEQIVQPTTNSLNLNTKGIYYVETINGTTTNYFATQAVYHTLGWANEFEQGAQQYTPPTLPNQPYETWDYLPFHDRDFTSPAELMLVPGCSPGLFTKQFVEFAPSYANISAIFSTVTPLTTPPTGGPAGYGLAPTAGQIGAYTTATATLMAPSLSSDTSLTPTPTINPRALQPHTFPYLNDKFFYSGYGQSNTLDPGGLVGGYTADGWFKMFEFFEVPSQMIGAIGPVAQGTNFDWLRQDTKPGQLNLNLIIDEEVFFSVLGKESITQTNAQQVNTASGLAQFPSDQFSQQLLNFDQIPGIAPGNYVPGTNGTLGFNFPLTGGSPPIPLVVTSTVANGSPASAYPLASFPFGNNGTPINGLLALDPLTNYNYNFNNATIVPPQPPYSNALKAAFVQFLSLRHGGSGYLFGFGRGGVGQNVSVNASATFPGANGAPFGAGIPAERPFHSLSYPDIDYTIMRPAALPPSPFTNPLPNPLPGTAASTLYGSGAIAPNQWNNPSTYNTVPLWNTFSGDPGVRNYWLYTGYPSAYLASAAFSPPLGWTEMAPTLFLGYPGVPTPAPPSATLPPPGTYWPVYPPPIPVRRLFQPPDAYNPNPNVLPTAATSPVLTPASASNASEPGDPSLNLLTVIPNPPTALTSLPTPAPGALPPITYTNSMGTYGEVLSNSVVSLYWPGRNAARLIDPAGLNPAVPVPLPSGVTDPHLGAGNAAGALSNYKQHPFWRTEQLQRVMNLTTTRTHQYAVWITVGFFEVTRQGDLGMLAFNPQLAFDILGPEIGAANGKSTRYRGFYVVDRLKLTGFNPGSSSAFRTAVIYSQRIQ